MILSLFHFTEGAPSHPTLYISILEWTAVNRLINLSIFLAPLGMCPCCEPICVAIVNGSQWTTSEASIQQSETESSPHSPAVACNCPNCASKAGWDLEMLLTSSSLYFCVTKQTLCQPLKVFFLLSRDIAFVTSHALTL